MANFATTTSLQTLMVGITWDTATSALANKCITHAEDKFILPILSVRYDISGWTAGTVPPSVISMSEEIAMGLMARYMSRGSKESLTRAKEIIDPVMIQLNKIAEFKAHLFDSNGSLIPDLSTGAYFIKSNTEDYHNTFNVDDPVDWGIDADQLDDIATERG